MPAWEDRLREAAYTAPDGNRLVFLYEDLSKTIRKKTSAHDFPDANETYVEDKGLRGQVFPLRIFLSGDNHDLAAAAFEALLTQRGPGVLEHPAYGRRNVVPMGDITRNDAVKTQANQTVFDVSFWETALQIYPSANDATVNTVDDAILAYDIASAGQFEGSIDLKSPGESTVFGRNMRQLKDGLEQGLQTAQDGTGALRSRMNKISKAINSTTQLLVGDPATLAFQMRQLATAPSRSKALLQARLDAYGNLITSLVAGTGTGSGGGTGTSENGEGVVDPGTGAPGERASISNTFHSNRLTAEVCVIGHASAVSGELFRTRNDALVAAQELIDVFESVADWSELNYTVLFDATSGPDPTRPASTGQGALDTGESRQALQDVVVRTLEYLIATSFTLDVERSVVLAAPRTAIDLVTELYGSLDDLDEFMAANDFTGDQILEIPAGTRVRYYA